MLAQILHIRDVGKRLVQLNIRLESGFIQQGLSNLPAKTQADGQPRADAPGVVDIGGPFAVPEIGFRQRDGDDGVIGIAQQEVRARVAAGCLRAGGAGGRVDLVNRLSK